MKLALVRQDTRRAAGVFDTEASTWQAVRGAGDLGPTGLLELLGVTDPDFEGPVRDLDDIELLAPIPRPLRNLICVGKNYFEHAEEFAKSGYDTTSGAEVVPKRPIYFTKPGTSIIGPNDTIDPHTDLTSELDYEAEVAIVLGRGGRNIGKDDAYGHIEWFTAANDVTARDLQRDHKQWFVGKSLDTFCPLGPWLVTADELDVDEISVSSYVNGEQRQQAKLSELIFDIPTLIATLSAGITLEPGDVILTGTPPGVGIGYTPPRFLRPGDAVRVEVSGVGHLSNIVGV